jgi:hypothetical protein
MSFGVARALDEHYMVRKSSSIPGRAKEAVILEVLGRDNILYLAVDSYE